MKENDALVLVFARNTFYKYMHYLVLAALALAIMLAIFLGSILVHLLRYPTQPLYFATDEVGRLFPVVPVDQPNMSDDDAADWTINAVQNALSYDFINFRAQLQNAQKYFTDYGWRTYMDAINSTNNLVALRERKMIFLAEVIGTPKIVTKGILGGAFAWKFDLSVLMTYMLPPFDAKSSFTNPLQVAVIVQRQPILNSYRGLGIVQIIANIAIVPGQAQQGGLTTGAPTSAP